MEIQIQNLQGRLAGWRPREELMLQLRSKGSLEHNSFFLWEQCMVYMPISEKVH